MVNRAVLYTCAALIFIAKGYALRCKLCSGADCGSNSVVVECDYEQIYNTHDPVGQINEALNPNIPQDPTYQCLYLDVSYTGNDGQSHDLLQLGCTHETTNICDIWDNNQPRRCTRCAEDSCNDVQSGSTTGTPLSTTTSAATTTVAATTSSTASASESSSTQSSAVSTSSTVAATTSSTASAIESTSTQSSAASTSSTVAATTSSTASATESSSSQSSAVTSPTAVQPSSTQPSTASQTTSTARPPVTGSTTTASTAASTSTGVPQTSTEKAAANSSQILRWLLISCLALPLALLLSASI